MEVGARIGTEGDLPALVELYRSSQAALTPERGGNLHVLREAMAEPVETRFEAIMHDDQWLVLLGTLDEAAVGVAVVRLDQMPDSSRLATVEALYVDPPAREVGVGEKLLSEVVDWAALSWRDRCRRARAPGHEDFEEFPGRVWLHRAAFWSCTTSWADSDNERAHGGGAPGPLSSQLCESAGTGGGSSNSAICRAPSGRGPSKASPGSCSDSGAGSTRASGGDSPRPQPWVQKRPWAPPPAPRRSRFRRTRSRTPLEASRCHQEPQETAPERPLAVQRPRSGSALPKPPRGPPRSIQGSASPLRQRTRKTAPPRPLAVQGPPSSIRARQPPRRRCRFPPRGRRRSGQQRPDAGHAHSGGAAGAAAEAEPTEAAWAAAAWAARASGQEPARCPPRRRALRTTSPEGSSGRPSGWIWRRIGELTAASRTASQRSTGVLELMAAPALAARRPTSAAGNRAVGSGG